MQWLLSDRHVVPRLLRTLRSVIIMTLDWPSPCSAEESIILFTGAQRPELMLR